MTDRLTAPELDDAIAQLTPERLEALQADRPTGYADQVHAAQAQAIQLISEKGPVLALRHGPPRSRYSRFPAL